MHLCIVKTDSQIKIQKMKILKNLMMRRILTSLAVIFMLSFMTLLSSCTATVHTPRQVRADVVIRSQGDDHHHYNRIERRERREHRDRD
jgi:hypothetical protein